MKEEGLECKRWQWVRLEQAYANDIISIPMCEGSETSIESLCAKMTRELLVAHFDAIITM